jgi:hypothetical protein
MPISSGNIPDAQPQNPYLPAGYEPLVMEMFQGLNTEVDRAGVPDNQCYWMENFFPYAPRLARKIYDLGSSIYSTPTVVFFQWTNLGSTPYCIIFKSDGSVLAVTQLGAVTTILPAATITSPSIVNCGVSQWNRTYVIIVSKQTNGYWLWDGTTTYSAGSIGAVIVTNGGNGYYSGGPVVSVYGGFGGGASLSAIVSGGQITSIAILNPGMGYHANDTPSITIVGGTAAGAGGSISVSWTQSSVGDNSEGIIWSAGILSASVQSVGSNYVNPIIAFNYTNFFNDTAFPAVVTGPILTLTTNPSSIGSLQSVVVTNPGQLVYVQNSSTVIANLVSFSVTSSVAQASASLEMMPFGIQGTTAEVYQGYVWVANGSTIFYSAPGSPINFGINSGGGNFISGDPFLRVNYVRLVNANGFLYLVADSSMNYISGVQTTGSTVLTTTFTNQNADPEVGTPYPQSVLTDGVSVVLANVWGIHGTRGATFDKISDPLDGVYNTAPSVFNGQQISAAKAIIYGKKCWIALVPVLDPITGAASTKMFMLNDKKWFAATQSVPVTFIGTNEVNGNLTAWGTNGTVISPLFAAPSTSIAGIIQSKFWDHPGGYELVKASSRFFSLWKYQTASLPSVTLTIDAVQPTSAASLTTQTSYSVTLGGPSASGYWLSPPQAIAQQGGLVGFTMKTNEADVTLISAKITSDPRISYRG